MAKPRDPDEPTTAVAAETALRDHLGRIETARRQILDSDDPEGAHQLRVGLRRLRAALTLFEPAIGGRRERALSEAARELGREVGMLRDLDVLCDDIVGPAQASRPDDPGLTALAAVLTDAIAEERARIRARLAGGDTARFLAALRGFADAGTWRAAAGKARLRRLDRPLGKTARKGLDHRWAKVTGAARHPKRMSTADRHALRKELKKLRYSVEVAAPALPHHRTEAFLDRLAELQKSFGDLNDAATAHQVLSVDLAPRLTEPAAGKAARRLARKAEARAEASWPATAALWKKLRKEDLPWR